MGETEDERMAQAGVLFENFVQASTCKGTLQAFSILCRQLELDPLDYSSFYGSLKAAVSTWKVKALWAKLDKRAEHKVYNQSKVCHGTRVRKTPPGRKIQIMRLKSNQLFSVSKGTSCQPFLQIETSSLSDASHWKSYKFLIIFRIYMIFPYYCNTLLLPISIFFF